MYISDNHELEWEFHFLGNEFEVHDEVIRQCNMVCANGFGGSENDWNEENKKQFAKSTIFGRLIDNNRSIYGIAYYFIPDEKIFNSYILWEAICLVNSVQGKGYAKKAVEDAVKLFPEREFRWLCCTTQNPSMFIRYSKYGKKLFPFDELYETSDGKLLMDFLCKHVESLKNIDINTMNISNGICKSFYENGKLGNYLADLPRAEKFDKNLQDWKFQRESGDAIIMALNLQ
jgi:hypothetical protein